jgi:hypothetical protein
MEKNLNVILEFKDQTKGIVVKGFDLTDVKCYDSDYMLTVREYAKQDMYFAYFHDYSDMLYIFNSITGEK